MLGRAAIVGLAALGLALFASPEATPAHEPSPSGRSRAEALTLTLVDITGRYQTASTAERSRLESSLVSTASARLELLASLIENDPAAVLAAALPAAIRSGLPSAVTAYLEQDAEIEGTLDLLHDDSASGSRYDYFLHSTGARYSLHFAGGPPEHLLTGATIHVKDVQVGNTLALAGGKTVQQVASAPAPTTLGEQRTSSSSSTSRTPRRNPTRRMTREVPCLPAFQKERLGWLNAGASPADHDDPNQRHVYARGLRTGRIGAESAQDPDIDGPEHGTTDLDYVESRQAIGFDGVLAGNTNVLNGV